MQVAYQRVPTLNNVTSTDFDQYINLYQSLSLDIAQHHAKLIQLDTLATKLQSLINASSLEGKYNEPLDALRKLEDDINKNLRKLLAFKETWSIYEILTEKLEYWIKAAGNEIKSVDVSNFEQPSNLRNFWELKAQHEVHNNVHNELANVFEQSLQILPLSDEILQRQYNTQLNEKWRLLSNKINGIQNAVIENISAPIVISEKLQILENELHELKITFDELHGIIKNEEELDLYIERLQIMSNRIDAIQNELGRIGLLPATESERVGALVPSSRRLEYQVAEEIDGSLLLKERLQTLDRGLMKVRRNHQRLNGTLDICESSQKLGSEVVEQSVRDCQEVLEELASDWQDLMSLRQLLHTLPMRLRVSVSPVQVERDISQLQDAHTAIEVRCKKLLGMLRDRLSLWRRFEHQLELVQQNVQEADYMVELLTVQGSVDYERLLKATERLEVSF